MSAHPRCASIMQGTRRQAWVTRGEYKHGAMSVHPRDALASTLTRTVPESGGDGGSLLCAQRATADEIVLEKAPLIDGANSVANSVPFGKLLLA